MIDDPIVRVISEIGFPIVMVLYFLIRFEKILGNNTAALRDIQLTISKCKGV